MMLRLQKYLSECGIASRRSAELLINEGKVKVNGVIASLGQQVDPQKDKVQVRNKIIKPTQKGVLLFYKPRDVVSTMSDPEGRRCLSDFLTKQYRSYFPVGRLDWESTGLVILTNDGELAERLFTFPSRYSCTIGHQCVFSLTEWSPQLPTQFLVLDRTQDTG